jgi:hypothetical protein
MVWCVYMCIQVAYERTFTSSPRLYIRLTRDSIMQDGVQNFWRGKVRWKNKREASLLLNFAPASVFFAIWFSLCRLVLVCHEL